jgi:voltage-gated potassium channel Kch
MLLADLLRRVARRPVGRGRYALPVFIIVAVLGVLAVHTLEAWFWAAVYLALGEFPTLEEALYFSVVTATTLGYGELVLSERWRLLSTFEAMGGLILFAVSAAFLVALLKRFLDPDAAG